MQQKINFYRYLPLFTNSTILQFYNTQFLLILNLIYMHIQTKNICTQCISINNNLNHQSDCNCTTFKCSICSNYINVKYCYQHFLEHRQKKCQKCDQMFYKSQESYHQIICKMHRQYCIYCDQQMQNKQFLDHKQKCKNRTKKCKYCDKFIKKIQILYHEQQCKQKYGESKVKKQCTKQFSDLNNQTKNQITNQHNFTKQSLLYSKQPTHCGKPYKHHQNILNSKIDHFPKNQDQKLQFAIQIVPSCLQISHVNQKYFASLNFINPQIHKF